MGGSTPKYSAGIYPQLLPTLTMDGRLTSLRTDMCMNVKIMVKADHGAGAKSIKAAHRGIVMATRICLRSVQQSHRERYD